MAVNQFCVLVTDLELGGTAAYGPYRSLRKAQEIAELFSSPYAATYYSPDKYAVVAAALNRAD